MNIEEFKTDEQLKEMKTAALYHLFRAVRAKESRIYNYAGPRCCEICHEYIGNDWQREVVDVAKPYTEYKGRIKRELDSRPDQFTHRNKRRLKQNHKPKFKREHHEGNRHRNGVQCGR